MFSDPRKVAINMDDFAPGASQNGLFMDYQDITYCQSCVISNQRQIQQSNSSIKLKPRKKPSYFMKMVAVMPVLQTIKNQIDWQKRDILLRRLCDKHRKQWQLRLLVPGSGGKDSFYQAHVLKYHRHELQ